MARVPLDSLNLEAAEKALILEALARAGSLIDAAVLLRVSVRRLSRLMVKHSIVWPRASKGTP